MSWTRCEYAWRFRVAGVLIFYRGKVIAETQHDEDIIFVDIGPSFRSLCTPHCVLTGALFADPEVFRSARAGIPVTTQRRFDVYPDVSKDFR